MKRHHRLRKPIDFKKAFKEGKRLVSPHFVLYVRKNEFSYARLGVSLQARHFKLATSRNRLRRVARELFRKELNKNLGSYDLVIASRTKHTDGDIKKATDDLKNLVLKLKV